MADRFTLFIPFSKVWFKETISYTSLVQRDNKLYHGNRMMTDIVLSLFWLSHCSLCLQWSLCRMVLYKQKKVKQTSGSARKSPSYMRKAIKSIVETLGPKMVEYFCKQTKIHDLTDEQHPSTCNLYVVYKNKYEQTKLQKNND